MSTISPRGGSGEDGSGCSIAALPGFSYRVGGVGDIPVIINEYRYLLLGLECNYGLT
jgi:hypothetical protein